MERTHRSGAREKVPDIAALFDGLFRHATDGVLFTRTDGTVLRANPAACRALGRTEQEVLGEGRAGLVVADECLASLLAERAQGGVARGELTFRRPDGTTFSGDVTSSLIASRSGIPHAYVIFRDATGRKAAARQAEENSRFLRAVLDTALDGFMIVGGDAALQDVNPAYCTMSGYSRDELLRMSITDLEDAETAEETASHIRRLRERGQDRFETRHRRKDGTLLELAVSASINSRGGEQIIAFLQDVGERKRAEREARERLDQVRFEKDRLAALLDSIRDEVWYTDTDGRVVLLNQAAVRGFGEAASTGEAIQDVAARIHVYRSDGSARPVQESPVLRSLRGESVIDQEELVQIPATGELRARQVSSAPVKDATGQVIGSVSVVRDITDHKLADAQRERLATAIEQADETVVITDPQGIITYVNPAFERVTGYTRAEAIGQNPRILKSGLHDERFYRAMWESIASGRTWRGRVVNRRKDGKTYTEEASISPVKDGAGAIRSFVAVKRDISAELELEARLLQSQKLESVGRLAGGVAHDFNNLLTVILSAGEDLRKAVRAGEPTDAEEVDEIVSAAHRASDLTRQLLAFARKQVISPSVVNLSEAVRNGDRMLRRVIGENVQVIERLEANPWPVVCDPGLLDQVILNLAVNARDAMVGGGQLTLTTRNTIVKDGDAVPDVEMPPGDYVMLSVKDTGSGMSLEVRQHIFEPFFTTKKPGQGTGLGLATVYGIVKQNGAFVGVRSAVGAGTTFEIYFPRAPPREEQGLAPMPTNQNGSEAVLLIEDDVDVRHATARALRSAGYQVHEADGGEQALRLVRQLRSPLHLVLTDVVMPGQGGREVARRIAEIRPGVRVLYMSGYTHEAISKHGVLDEGLDFLPKPFTPDTLLLRVRQSLDRTISSRGG